jgi:hypothetical protein
MNFISTNHQGGIGNVMFKLAAAISLALDNNIDYIFSNEFIRPADRVATNGYDDYRVYYSNILRNIQFINNLTTNYKIFNQSGFHFEPIPYMCGDNLLLMGHYQSEKYFEKNKRYICDLFKPTNEIKQLILSKYLDVTNLVSIHVRRGDYLQYPNHHPQQTSEYYQTAAEQIGIDREYIIFSDDLDGCVDMFNFLPNKQFFTTNIDWLDLYMMSLCSDNIICNSSFSWWAAYLNESDNKQVIAPSRWFGSAYSDYNTSDLFPQDWIILDI